jgi:hypothetical protein
MKLKDLIVDAKTVWVPFDGHEDFEVEMAYVSRTEMSKLVKSCQESKMNRSTRQIETELNSEKFLSAFVKRVILGWRGLSMEILAEFVPIEYDADNADKELPYDDANALFLIKESQMFDDWLNEKVNDIDTFRRK